MPKAYDLRRWRGELRYDAENNTHYDEVRVIHVVERDVSTGADNRNSLSAVRADLNAATASASEIAADPNRVDGSTLIPGAPHPDGDLATAGVQIRGFVGVKIINQWEAEIGIWYTIPYPNNTWGAGIVNQPAMETRRETEWLRIPTIYTVNRPQGGTGREVFGARPIERSTLHVTLSTTVSVAGYPALAVYLGDAAESLNKIETTPLLGSDPRLKDWIIRGSFLVGDPQTSALTNGSGRWSYVTQYRLKAPIKALPVDPLYPNSIAIPAVPANAEIDLRLDENAQPGYRVFLPEDNYDSLNP